MQEHASGRLDARMDVNLGMAQRHRDELEHLLHAGVHPAEVREAGRRRRVVFRNSPRVTAQLRPLAALLPDCTRRAHLPLSI